ADGGLNGALGRVGVSLHQGVVGLLHGAVTEGPLEHRVSPFRGGTTITPEVPTSSRWTMPLRSGGPEVEMRKPAAARPPTTVGPSQPTVGCAATPTGLFTAMRSSSA